MGITRRAQPQYRAGMHRNEIRRDDSTVQRGRHQLYQKFTFCNNIRLCTENCALALITFQVMQGAGTPGALRKPITALLREIRSCHPLRRAKSRMKSTSASTLACSTAL